MQQVNAKRIRTLHIGKHGGGPVIYWMSRDQRVRDNWAMIAAQEYAINAGKPLAVVFCLADGFLGAAFRQYCFMLKGLRQVERDLVKYGIPFFMLNGGPESALPPFLRALKACCVVTDFDPLRIKKRWKRAVTDIAGVTLHEIDAHNIIPCWLASPKREYGAYTIRPRIHRALGEFLVEFPPLRRHPFPWLGTVLPIDWRKIEEGIRVDRSVTELDWIIPGETEAHSSLSSFIRNRLPDYDTARNDPLREGQSDLSPYLHFGQLSAQRVALEVEKSAASRVARSAFLEELIVRRELSDNFCHYCEDYDRFQSFPDWARTTLDLHRGDRRDYIYTLEDFTEAGTHDPLWNAAQKEMVQRGKMHGYLRMYWAKKILEWTASPEDALDIAIALNDRYELDGRDPNGYAGIAWSIGGVHDRAWNERAVFGKIRYMSFNGCRSKFDVNAYIKRFS